MKLETSVLTNDPKSEVGDLLQHVQHSAAQPCASHLDASSLRCMGAPVSMGCRNGSSNTSLSLPCFQNLEANGIRPYERRSTIDSMN